MYYESFVLPPPPPPPPMLLPYEAAAAAALLLLLPLLLQRFGPFAGHGLPSEKTELSHSEKVNATPNTQTGGPGHPIRPVPVLIQKYVLGSTEQNSEKPCHSRIRISTNPYPISAKVTRHLFKKSQLSHIFTL